MAVKTYDFSRGVGHTLKLQREELGLPLSKVSREVNIPEGTLRKFETSAYDQLDHSVYELGFIKRYADYLGLDTGLAAKKYLLERGELPNSKQRLSKSKVKSAIVTTRLFSTAVILLIVAIVVGYLVWQAAILTSNPRLSVSSPQDNQEVSGLTLQVIGKTDPGAEVEVDGSQVFVDDDGSFTGTVTLQEGVGTISVTARNTLGRTTTITRNVLVEGRSMTESLPTSVFDGVAVELTVVDSVYVTAVSDGNTVFSGTLTPDMAQVIQAENRIELRTDNPERLQVRYTNSRVAGAVLEQAANSPVVVTRSTIDETAETE